jgi:lysophospholipid acyltransferase (LPLAT)-like uncharacterized protein
MPPVAKKRVSGVVIPEKPRWFQRLAARLIWLILKIISLTLRYHWTDRTDLNERKARGPAIYCVWHNRMALSMVCYFSYIRHYSTGAGLASMMSASKDGALMAAVMECFGVQPIRGSTSRRGPQALRELTTWSRRDYDLAMVPDGPRGPRYVVGDGPIALAQLTGRGIVPVSYNLRWKITMKSWDRFQIPLPFSRCDLIFEKTIYVPRKANEEEREQLRLQLENTLKAISED